MEKELLELLNQARSKGANKHQLQIVVNNYNSKKKINSESDSEPTQQNVESNGIAKVQDTSLDIAKPINDTYDLRTQKKSEDFTEPFSVEKATEQHLLNVYEKYKNPPIEEDSLGTKVFDGIRKGFGNMATRQPDTLEERRIDFLGELDPKTKDELTSFVSEKKIELSKANMSNLAETKVIENKANSDYEQFTKLQSQIDKGEIEVTEEVEQRYKSLQGSLVKAATQLKETRIGFENSTEDIQDFDKELNLLKRNYNEWDNFIGQAGAGFERLGAGITQWGNEWLKNIKNPEHSALSKVVANEFRGGVEVAKNEVKNTYDKNTEANKDWNIAIAQKLENLRPEIKVENIKSPTDFLKWGGQVVAQQTSVLATISVPYVGYSLLYAGSAGGKNLEMRTEMDNSLGTINYTDEQIHWASIGYGASDVLFEKLGSGTILKNGKRVFQSMLKQGAKEVPEEVGEGFVKTVVRENSTEIATGIVQTGVIDMWYLDKEFTSKELASQLKETVAQSTLMASGMHVAPILLGSVARKFSTTEQLKTLKVREEKLNKMVETIQNGNLTEEQKIVLDGEIKKELKATKKEFADGVNKINSLPKEDAIAVLNQNTKIKEIVGKAKVLEETEMDETSKGVLAKKYKEDLTKAIEKKEEILAKPITDNTQEGTKPIAEIVPEKVDNKANEEISPIKPITIYRGEGGGGEGGSWNGAGTYFSDNEGEASLYGEVKKYTVRLEKPFVLTGIKDTSVQGSGLVKLFGETEGLKDEKHNGKTYEEISKTISEIENGIDESKIEVYDGGKEGYKNVFYEYNGNDYIINGRTKAEYENLAYMKSLIIQRILDKEHNISGLPIRVKDAMNPSEFSKILESKGYDGIIAENSTLPNGNEYVLFDRNKAIEEKNQVAPIENKELSEAVKNTFPDSKIKDIVYHDTDVKFDKFDEDKIGKFDEGTLGRGFYFSSKAKSFNPTAKETLNVVLDIKNPALVDYTIYELGDNRADGLKNDEIIIHDKQHLLDILPIADSDAKKTKKELIEGLDGYYNKKIKTTELSKIVRDIYIKNGYDGIISSGTTSFSGKEYVVFNSNQIKIIPDENQKKGDITPNANIQPNIEQNNEQGQVDNIQPAKDVEGDNGDVEVKGKNTTFIPKKETIKDDRGNPITFYHGSNNEFTDFDESMMGDFTGADSAKEGFFFTNNKNVANSYRQQSIYDAPNIEGLKEILNGLSKEEIAKIGAKALYQRDEKYSYEDLTKQESIDDIIDEITNDTESQSYYQDRRNYTERIAKILKEKDIDFKPYLDKGQIVETHLDIKNPKIVDAQEQSAEDIGLTKIIREAKEQGHDGVIIKNTYDSMTFDDKGNDSEINDVVVVFDKKQINIKNKPIANDVEVKNNKANQQNSLVDAKNEFNKLNNKDKKGAKGSELRTKITNLAKELSFKVSDKNNRISVKGVNGKEAGKISFKENIADASQEDIDNAKKYISNGVLNWGGDVSSPRVNLDGVSWAEIRKGEKDIKEGKTSSMPAKRLINAIKIANENGGFEYVQGAGGQITKQFVSLDNIQRANNDENLNDAELQEINEKQNELFTQYKNDFNKLDKQSQNDILDNYENRENNKGEIQSDSEIGYSKDAIPDKPKQEKPTTKERIAERIKISDAEIDDWKNALKGADNIFGIPIRIKNIDDINTDGISQNALIDIIADIVKQAVHAGIHIDEAIKKTIEHFGKTLEFDIDPNDVKAKVEGEKPKVEKKVVEPKVVDDNKDDNKADDGFKRRVGKNSLLARLLKGGNSDVITEELGKINPNNAVRNQEKADADAQLFINKVGVAEALKAVEDGLIKNADIEMLIFNEALNRLQNEIDNDVNIDDKADLINKFHELTTLFKDKARNYGQGISILNYIYNKDQSLKYELSKVIDDYKRNDPDGKIPDEVLLRFTELDAKLKDLEVQIKNAEKRAKEAEDLLNIKNIKDDIDRQNKVNKAKDSNAKKAKDLANKIRQVKFHKPNVFSAATPASLVWDGAIEVVAKTIETGGKLTDAIQKGVEYIKKSNWYKKLSDTKKSEAEKSFSESLKSASKPKTIKIDESGKITIPTQLLRDYVEAGETDIDVIAGLIKEDIKDEFPDVEIREIRDAISGYGRRINPSKDEITVEISKIKGLGKLISAYEDALKGIRPLKSGLQRAKPTQEMRELKKEVNRLIKEIGLSEADLEIEWASAIDKVKASLRNQIEDLDKQIANGEKRKIERNPIRLDDEAKSLRDIRDEKRKILDELVGKPELTSEQLIDRAEKSLETQIDNLQKAIASGDVAYKTKPEPKQSEKLTELRNQRKALTDALNEIRRESGLVEEQRLKTAKSRVKGQIEQYRTKIQNSDFAKKVVKPVIPDAELNKLRAEKEAIFEEFEKLKYIQELKNRSFGKKLLDSLLELGGLTRAIKASLDLGLVGIQLGGLTYSELLRNPKGLGRKFAQMFGAIGSKNKTDEARKLLVGHPLYTLAKKLDIGLTNPDLRDEVKEEMAAGSMLSYIWRVPVIAAELAGAKKITHKERRALGDTFIDGFNEQLNKLSKKQRPLKNGKKITIAEQWRNINPFSAVERGLSVYGNQLRFEEFVRGVELLKAEGKDELNNLEHYKDVASYIRTFSGRAKPAGFEMNQKALNLFFFSFKNAASVFQQLNPAYYLYLQAANVKEGNFKPSVANKMAMATMFKSVAMRVASITFIMTAYAAFKGDDDDEMTIETDPTSSDYGKIKLGDFRYDLWGGYIPLITLYARIYSEEVKKADGTKYKFGEDYNGIKNRGDAISRFMINKESPGFQMIHKYITSVEKVDKVTGESKRVLPFGKDLLDDESYSLYPIFLGSVKEAIKEDFNGVQSFLTAYSVLGLGNVQYYGEKKLTKEDAERIRQERLDKFKVTPEEKQEKYEKKIENKIKAKEAEDAERAEFKRLGVEWISDKKGRKPANPNAPKRDRDNQRGRQ